MLANTSSIACTFCLSLTKKHLADNGNPLSSAITVMHILWIASVGTTIGRPWTGNARPYINKKRGNNDESVELTHRR